MILFSLILILLVGGVSSWIIARRHETSARWIAVASVGADLLDHHRDMDGQRWTVAVRRAALVGRVQFQLDFAVWHSLPPGTRWP